MTRRSDDQPKVTPPHSFATFCQNIIRVLLFSFLVAGGYWVVASTQDKSPHDENAVVYQQDISELPIFDDNNLTEFSSATELSAVPPEEEDVIIVDSATLDVDLIEKKLTPVISEVSKHAQNTPVDVYPNADGILIKPGSPTKPVSDVTSETSNNHSSVSQNSPADDSVTSDESSDTEAIEATYEEPLPEGEYQEPTEPLPQGYHVYHGHKNLRDIEIDVSHKPPYFGEEPVIAIVIDDMGISHARTKDISTLHAPITSSFLTYGTKLDAQVAKARAAGHEIIVHVPMQPKSNLDTAPDELTIKMSPEEISRNFEQMLNKFENIKGVNNHMGSLFTEHAEKLAPVMEILGRKGLYFLDSKTSSHSVARQVAKQHQVAYAHRHVFLDNVNQVEYVNRHGIPAHICQVIVPGRQYVEHEYYPACSQQEDKASCDNVQIPSYSQIRSGISQQVPFLRNLRHTVGQHKRYSHQRSSQYGSLVFFKGSYLLYVLRSAVIAYHKKRQIGDDPSQSHKFGQERDTSCDHIKAQANGHKTRHFHHVFQQKLIHEKGQHEPHGKRRLVQIKSSISVYQKPYGIKERYAQKIRPESRLK